MWRDETSVVRDERRARRVLPGGLFGQDVEIRRRESVVVERGEERALVDDGASRRVDETTARFESTEKRRVDKPFGFCRKRYM